MLVRVLFAVGAVVTGYKCKVAETEYHSLEETVFVGSGIGGAGSGIFARQLQLVLQRRKRLRNLFGSRLKVFSGLTAWLLYGRIPAWAGVSVVVLSVSFWFIYPMQ